MAWSFVLRENNITPKLLSNCCRAYHLLNQRSAYYKQLGNFLREGDWEREKGNADDIEGFEERVSKRYRLANKLIRRWNEARPRHWAEIVDSDNKIGMIVRSLGNSFFRKNWEQALDVAKEVFAKQDGNEWRQQFIPNIKWFCDISEGSLTVAKIIEGDYGRPKRTFESRPYQMEFPDDCVPKEQSKDLTTVTKLITSRPNRIAKTFESVYSMIGQNWYVIIESEKKNGITTEFAVLKFQGIQQKQIKIRSSANVDSDGYISDPIVYDEESAFKTLLKEAQEYNETNYTPSTN